MPMYFFKGGTVMWPILLCSVAALAILAGAAGYHPTVGRYRQVRTKADREAMPEVVVKLLDAILLSGIGACSIETEEKGGGG